MAQTLTQTIYKILGSNNILLIVPNGHSSIQVPQRVNYIADLALVLAERLRCYAVVNTKYKPEIMDLSNLTAIQDRPRVVQAFLEPIKRFQEEITHNGLIPLVIILQPLPPTERPDAMLLLGYGQGERGSDAAPHHPTLSASQLSKIRLSCEDHHLSTKIAPINSPFCAREPNHINQLFRIKQHTDYFTPEVCSFVIHFRWDLISQQQTALSIAEILGAALAPFSNAMSLVRVIDLNNIDTNSIEDLQYIFRLRGDSPYVELWSESYIEELAQSIDRNGLLHPLVLLKKNDGRYKILCGYRRFQALKRLDKSHVEAKVYNESDFSVEDFYNISLAENTSRRNLNPIEIGNFLESASSSLGLNNAELAQQFGSTLGIGRPGQKVSHSTIHKYRKVNQIRIRGESPEIISDVVNEKLQFSIASEVLAPIKDNKARDALYLHIIQPFSPTRPQLTKIMHLLANISPHLYEAITSPKVQQAILLANNSAQPAVSFLKHLSARAEIHQNAKNFNLEDKITAIRKNIFGEKACKQDFNVLPASPTKRDELIIQFRLKKGQTEHTLAQLHQALSQTDLFRST